MNMPIFFLPYLSLDSSERIFFIFLLFLIPKLEAFILKRIFSRYGLIFPFAYFALVFLVCMFLRFYVKSKAIKFQNLLETFLLTIFLLQKDQYAKMFH